MFKGIACIVGAARFKELYDEAKRELTLMGYAVFDAGTFVHHEEDPKVVERLNAAHRYVSELHRKKIEIAHVVVLVAGEHEGEANYVGRDTKSDLDYARRLNKSILYYKNGRLFNFQGFV